MKALKTLKTLGLVVIVLGAFLALGLGGSLHTAKDFTVTCSTSPTLITATGVDGFDSVYCDNNSTTSVFLGGADVDTTGLCISTNTSNCPRRDMPADYARGALYCTVAASTQAINCLAGK